MEDLDGASWRETLPQEPATANPVIHAPFVEDGPATVSCGAKAILRIEPGAPIAGRDIVFALEGLDPWQEIAVEFLDPQGRPAAWVSEEGVLFFGEAGPRSSRVIYADGQGHAAWGRAAVADSEGVWSVRIAAREWAVVVRYAVRQIELPGGRLRIGPVMMNRWQGPASTLYHSALVPKALVVDLAAHLAWVAARLGEELRLPPGPLPDVHLLADRALLDEVSRVAGQDPEDDGGYYRPFPPFPGIYLRTDFLRPGMFRLLSHEYVHLVIMEAAASYPLPAWLNEGMAVYWECELGCLGPYPDEARRQLHASVGEAKAALERDALPPLGVLEAQGRWSAGQDAGQVRLRYAAAHMTVRYLCEAHGPAAPLAVARGVGQGKSTDRALRDTLGYDCTGLQGRCAAWLASWEHPDRREVRDYLRALDPILTAEAMLSARRADALSGKAPAGGKTAAWRRLALDAQELQEWLAATPPPKRLGGFHDLADAYVGRLVEWLAREAEYAQTRSEHQRLLANAMVPEIRARSNTLADRLAAIKSMYQL